MSLEGEELMLFTEFKKADPSDLRPQDDKKVNLQKFWNTIKFQFLTLRLLLLHYLIIFP
jgi:hypothetical protein